jgi:hypothetical protein
MWIYHLMACEEVVVGIGRRLFHITGYDDKKQDRI